MIDIHSHIIPKIDDGSQSFEESYSIFEEASKAGFTAIISTSHYIEGYNEMNSIKRHAWVQAMNKILEENEIELQLYSGAEIYVTPNMVSLLKEKKAATLADSRYVLFELPINTNIKYLEEIIFQIQSAGLVPIIAHPERYEYVQKEPNLLLPLIQKGVLFQSNYGSLVGIYGNTAKNTIKKLLKANMIHFFGSDVHKKDTIYRKMNEIMIQLEKILSKEKIEEFTTVNPQHIINNEEITITNPNKINNKFKITNFLKN